MDEPKQAQSISIPHVVADPVVNIALDTFSKDRQLIVFVNTKRGAESQAEKIATKLQSTPELEALSEKILKALVQPTKQCKRLAAMVKRGAAFHHAGLHAKQRDLIEDAFRDKHLKAICATPTLAAGVDLPAFRVIVRDLKRYGGPWGMSPIPVLEYEQMAGRAGRPGKDPWGEAICIAKNDGDEEEIIETYINGDPEEIYSKLAVEPVLRTYVLSLVASKFVGTMDELQHFFSTTFYAHQYGDLDKLNAIIERVVTKLQDWGFIEGGLESSEQDDFVSASDLTVDKNELLKATILGERVSELYLDPYTAYHLIKGFERAQDRRKSIFALAHLCASTLELRPYLSVKSAELGIVEEKLTVEETALLHIAPSAYSEEFDTYLDTIKTTMLFEAWMEEESEEDLLERYSVRPGELHAKLANMDWIVYAATEIARLLNKREVRSDLQKLRTRLKHGAKEELLPLLKLRGIGRVRARTLFKNSIKDVAGLQHIDPTSLAQLVGKAVAISLKKQVGQDIDPKRIEVKPNKRKGQFSLQDWSD